MTREKKGLTLAVLATVLAALVLKVAASAWDSKVPRTEYEAHVNEFRSQRRVDSLWQVEQRDIAIVTLCKVAPGDSRCDERRRP